MDHFKLKNRDCVFWMEVYAKTTQFSSEFAHTQMEKVWSRIILVHSISFLGYSMFACAMYRFFVINFFFQLPDHYFSRQKVLTQWAQPSIHYPRSYLFIGTNSILACFQMYVKSTFFLFFFFQLSYDFF